MSIDFFRKRGSSPIEIRELPLYCVRETLPSVSSFGEYRNRVLKFLDLEQEDILSNLVRAISFDETGYKGSEMYVVKPAVQISRAETFLEDGKCLYTTLIADNNDPSVPEKMFDLCHNWATEHKASFRGVVYIFIRFVMLTQAGIHAVDDLQGAPGHAVAAQSRRLLPLQRVLKGLGDQQEVLKAPFQRRFHCKDRVGIALFAGKHHGFRRQMWVLIGI